MNPDEIRRYFEKNPPPKEVAWKPWAKITDTKKFLESCYSSISNYKAILKAAQPSGISKNFILICWKA